MPDSERHSLLQRMDKTRQTIETILPTLDRDGEIYPGWTIKEMLAHMTGWDDATIDALQAHLDNRPLAIPAIRSLDEYNAGTVSTRKNLDYEQVVKEWRHTHQVLRSIIEQMPEEKFNQPLVVPWGETATVTALVDMFRGHDEEHLHDILEWAREPSHPLEKQGN